jgi:hypothetical protein
MKTYTLEISYLNGDMARSSQTCKYLGVLINNAERKVAEVMQSNSKAALKREAATFGDFDLLDKA